jgi:hypothetical protein
MTSSYLVMPLYPRRQWEVELLFGGEGDLVESAE